MLLSRDHKHNPTLPRTQVWLGYQHLSWDTRWRIWNGTCARSDCHLGTVATGGVCTALDCPTWARQACRFTDKDHPMVRRGGGAIRGWGKRAERARGQGLRLRALVAGKRVPSPQERMVRLGGAATSSG